ncbi:MAG TPA: hypothetical protein VGM19_12835 [Armatimonadota bacterium]|jgi:hypothetical protein
MAYEYRVEHKPAGSRMGQINDRLATLTEEGWEPFMMSGADDLAIMLRRVKPAAAPAAPAAPPTQV